MQKKVWRSKVVDLRCWGCGKSMVRRIVGSTILFIKIKTKNMFIGGLGYIEKINWMWRIIFLFLKGPDYFLRAKHKQEQMFYHDFYLPWANPCWASTNLQILIEKVPTSKGVSPRPVFFNLGSVELRGSSKSLLSSVNRF